MPAPQPILSPEALLAANINPHTGLATDFLNHYNEVVMLIGILADMPEARDEILDWVPIAYETHFTQTGFRERDLAIAAFRQASTDIIERFSAACRQIDARIEDVQRLVRAGEVLPDATAAEFQALIAAAGAIINEGLDGPTAVSDEQALIDSLFD